MWNNWGYKRGKIYREIYLDNVVKELVGMKVNSAFGKAI